MLQRKKFYISIISFLVLVVASKSYNSYFLHQPTGENLSKSQEMLKISSLTLERVGTQMVDIPTLKGRPVMINFWASWCAACMEEMPSIYKLKDKYKTKGFEVFSINLDNDVTVGLRRLARKFGKPNFPVIRGYGEKYPEIFRVEGLPYTILIDRKGIIRYSGLGERDWLDQKSLSLLERIL